MSRRRSWAANPALGADGSLGLAERVEGIRLGFSHRRSLRRLGGTPGGPARGAPRWRGRCGRGARPPRAPTTRRGSGGSAPTGGGHRGEPSTSWATAASSCASHGSSSGVGSSATARRLRSSRACRRQWSTSLWRATPINHAVVRRGTEPFCTAATAARKVSAVRSSATVVPSQRRTQVPVDLGQRGVVQREQGRTLVGRARSLAHIPIIVAHDRAPTSVRRKRVAWRTCFRAQT